MAEIEVNFNIESETTVRERLSKGYRARRNFLVAELLSMIVRSTPVKDGYARGGWYVTTGRAGTSAPRAPDKDGGLTILAGIMALRGASPFKDVFINNDVPYIEDLENGSSGQAPEGMVRVSLSAFKSMHGDVQ